MRYYEPPVLVTHGLRIGIRIQPEAFRDRYKKPSVDRASLVEYIPSAVLLNPTNGIVSLMARDARAIADVVTTTRDKTVNHVVDVVHDPTPERQSHAIINVNPEFFDSESKQKKVFKFLQKALARLATINGWTLRPGED